MHLKSRRDNIKYGSRHKLAGILLLVFLLMIWLPASFPAEVQAATTNDTLAQVKAKQTALAKERAELEAQTAQLNQSLNKLSGKLSWLNERSEEQRKLYQGKTAQLQAAISGMEKAYADYSRAEEDLLQKQEQYVERLQVMFDYQQRSILQIFMEAKSLQGFFTTLQFMTIVADTDQQMIEALEAAKDNAALLRDQAQKRSADMEIVVNQLKGDLDKLKTDAKVTQSDLNQAELKLSEQEKAEDELNQESQQVAAEVAALQKKLAAEQAAKATAAAKANAIVKANAVSSNGWTWPYPADRNVYSPYGMRYHPVYHVNRFHSGVDLGGSYGSPIVAARSGTVLLVRNPLQGRNTGGSGYGNYVVIAHANGFSSLYAHLKTTLVSVGQEVRAGDRIGLCGSTGTSTGPHLHFEIMVDGHTVNPILYIR